MIDSLRRLLPKGRFARRLAVLSGGTALGQAILILAAPLLTRLYSPEEFGLLAIYSSISAILGMVMALRYEFAVPLCRDETEAADMVGAAMVTVLLMTGLVTLGVWLGGPPLAASVGAPELATLFWILPPSLFAFGLSQPINYWLIRGGAFRANAINRVVQALGQVTPQLGLGLAGLGGLGLIVGYGLGYVARAGHLLAALQRRDWALLRAVQPGRAVRMAREHWRYPVFSTLSTLCIAATQLLPAVLLGVLYGPTVAGWFGLSQRLLATPAHMVGQAASQVYLAEVPKLRDAQAIFRLFMKASGRFLALGLVGMAPLLLLGPSLFALVFGPGWREAGVMAQLLVPLHLARFVVTPVSQTLNIFQRQDLHMLAALKSALSLGLSFAAGWWLELSPLWTIALYSLGATAAQLLYFLMAWRVARTAGLPPAVAGAADAPDEA